MFIHFLLAICVTQPFLAAAAVGLLVLSSCRAIPCQCRQLSVAVAAAAVGLPLRGLEQTYVLLLFVEPSPEQEVAISEWALGGDQGGMGGQRSCINFVAAHCELAAPSGSFPCCLCPPQSPRDHRRYVLADYTHSIPPVPCHTVSL